MNKTVLLGTVLAAMLTFSAAQAAVNETMPLQAGNCLHEFALHKRGYGYVTIKSVRAGTYDVTFALWKAAPKYPYCIEIKSADALGRVILWEGTLQTDKKGNGSVTARLTNTDPVEWGNWLGIRESDCELSSCQTPVWPEWQQQSLWAAANPFNPPSPPVEPQAE